MYGLVMKLVFGDEEIRNGPTSNRPHAFIEFCAYRRNSYDFIRAERVRDTAVVCVTCHVGAANTSTVDCRVDSRAELVTCKETLQIQVHKGGDLGSSSVDSRNQNNAENENLHFLILKID